MALPIVLTGINGAMGLYSTVKGFLDSNKSRKKQENLKKAAWDNEAAWYRRNYYGNFMDNAASKAAIKRVENSLRRNNEQERARSVIVGSTPEHAIARNEQGLRSMENVITNLATIESGNRQNVDASHKQNRMALMNSELQNLSYDERKADSSVGSGLNLIQNALLGVKWGKEGKL